eukprot:1791747-Rhodomonas_salina.2
MSWPVRLPRRAVAMALMSLSAMSLCILLCAWAVHVQSPILCPMVSLAFLHSTHFGSFVPPLLREMTDAVGKQNKRACMMSLTACSWSVGSLYATPNRGIRFDLVRGVVWRVARPLQSIWPREGVRMSP